MRPLGLERLLAAGTPFERMLPGQALRLAGAPPGADPALDCRIAGWDNWMIARNRRTLLHAPTGPRSRAGGALGRPDIRATIGLRGVEATCD